LATPASERALEMAGLSPKKLDIIIVGTSSADMLSPSAACILSNIDWGQKMLWPSMSMQPARDSSMVWR